MDHTFVVCAYKESPFLEECVKSVVNQTINSHVLISTSTPNQYIEEVAKKYGLKVVVNKGRGDAADNFNFAYSQVCTKYVTICHQDDYYAADYLENVKEIIDNAEKPIIVFTDYLEDRDSRIVSNNRILCIKRWMLSPFKNKRLRKSKRVRKFILGIGCPICCPSVTYNKQIIDNPKFESEWSATMDWRAWIRFAKMDGEFCYVPKALEYHRIHEGSETSEVIKKGLRTKEELEIYKEMWPRWFAYIISKIYVKAQKSNEKKLN